MKKSKLSVSKILIVLVILITLLLVINKIIDIREKRIIKSCDLVIGVYIFYSPFRDEKVLYGYKDDKLIKIGNRFKTDQSNFNYIIGTKDAIGYFDYDTFMKLSANNNGTHNVDYYSMSIDSPFEEEEFNKYYNDYNYDSEELTKFQIMMYSLINKHKNDDQYYSPEYFFAIDNEYYLYVNEKEKSVMYKYEDNILKKVFEFTGNERLLYFKKNK